MANIGKALKQGAKAFADSLGPGQYSACGKKITCPHCALDLFNEGSSQLNTAGMTFLGLDWANKSATTLVCKNCGHILWFMRQPERG